MSEHESSHDKPRDIGLKAIRAARVERLATKSGRVSGKAWLVAIGFGVAVVVCATLYRDRSLASIKEDIASKRRATIATVGAEWFPLRDKMEKTTLEAAGPYKGDFIDPATASWDFRRLPGIYLRLRVEDATDVAALRKKADDSSRDSFVGCLMRENNPSAMRTARGEDAGSGWDDQPWNLRLAYYATRVLSDEWLSEMESSEDELHFRVFKDQFEKAQPEEIPLAIQIVKRAQFFLLVLDEDVPEAHDLAPDAGRNAGKVTERELQQVPHPTRIVLIDLKTGKEMVRLRQDGGTGSAGFDFHPGTDPQGNAERLTWGARDPRVRAAVQRQVNNCALADDVWTRIRAAAK